ncbi:hypothetical protein RJ80_gp14 [Vibrio phage phi-A318]|uniref:Uncharacterized protein n=1 Tax=Vibrio phage phi-A318 TaxID=1151014 RepID=A0A067YBI9_9CAUD|nr:hypothetical protein RJ80_gp14 [Vibrio phage phi-A318]AGZ17787.1 hypothetical protein [Vibrio phage phi-A318]
MTLPVNIFEILPLYKAAPTSSIIYPLIKTAFRYHVTSG